MEKISGFQITGMTLSGFKCYAQPTEVAFGNPTVITGGNGRGKSSVADAISFAVTGLPFFGERGIDRLHSEDNGDLFLSMRFIDDRGRTHELTRGRRKNTMTITYDGNTVRQADLTELFGEKDVFLSILNPLYFIEELGDDGKKLLERYLPDITQEEVLAQLAPSIQEALREEKMLSPDTYLKSVRESIRELESGVVYLTGQKDLAESQRQEAKDRVTKLTQRLDELQSETNELESRRFTGMDLAELQERLVERSTRYEELSQEAPVTADTSQLDSKLADLHRKLGKCQAQQYQPKYAKPIAEASAKVETLAGKYRRQAALLKGFQTGTVCPACQRAVTENELPAVQSELKKALEQVVSQGKEAKSQLDELTALEKQTEDTFLRFQTDDVTKLENEIAALTAQKAKIVEDSEKQNGERRVALENLLTEIRDLTTDTECGALSEEEYSRLTELRQEMETCRADLAAAERMANTAPEDYDAKINETRALIQERQKKIANAALYVSKRAEMLFSSLRMNRVQISLFDVVKTTGEVKDAFKFTYNGRRYDRLSLSEKIRAGMEVSELMKRLTGRNYPVFLDNMESVDDINNVRPTGQIIMAKCVRGAELSVRPAGQSRQIPKAA